MWWDEGCLLSLSRLSRLSLSSVSLVSSLVSGLVSGLVSSLVSSRLIFPSPPPPPTPPPPSHSSSPPTLPAPTHNRAQYLEDQEAGGSARELLEGYAELALPAVDAVLESAMQELGAEMGEGTVEETLCIIGHAVYIPSLVRHALL